MNLKLVAIDVDGTLLNDRYEITERTKKALLDIKEQGVKVILASGRGPNACFPIAMELGITDPLITHNGAVLIHPTTKESEFEIGFKAKELSPIIEYCRKHSIHFDINTALDMFVEGIPVHAVDMYQKFFMTPNIVPDTSELQEQIVKFSLFGEEAEIDQAFADLSPLYPELSIIRSGERFIDVIHPRATKGNTLRQLLADFDILPEETIAFGNYFNDLEMIELAGLGVAMANSPDQVKDLADRVTASNNEDGVALVIEEFLR
jgi:Cof subfamily protein (haloacid dehalogenase superfamily)